MRRFALLAFALALTFAQTALAQTGNATTGAGNATTGAANATTTTTGAPATTGAASPSPDEETTGLDTGLIVAIVIVSVVGGVGIIAAAWTMISANGNGNGNTGNARYGRI